MFHLFQIPNVSGKPAFPERRGTLFSELSRLSGKEGLGVPLVRWLAAFMHDLMQCICEFRAGGQ